MKTKKNNAIFQSYLLQDEQILWIGKPSPWQLLSVSDIFLIPFSFMWGGFAIFWVIMASNAGIFALFGVPFVVIGQYFIWGRFVHAYLRRKQTRYAITNFRVLILKKLGGRQLESYALEQIPSIVWRGNNIYLTEAPSLFSNMARSNGMGIWTNDTLPGLYGLNDAEPVHNLLQELTLSTDRHDLYISHKNVNIDY